MIAPKYFFCSYQYYFCFESRAYLLILPVRYPSWIGRSLFRTCTGLPIGRLGTTDAAVTKRHLAKRLATRTAFREPDISRAEPHKLRYAARRRGTLGRPAPLPLSESPPTKETFSRGNKSYDSVSRLISVLSFSFNSRFPAASQFHRVSTRSTLKFDQVSRHSGVISATRFT